MGYMRHHGMLVTTFDESMAKTAHEKAVEIFGSLVSPFVESKINGYFSFAVFPDGSNEGWPDSDKGDARRETFKAWLKTTRYEDGSSRYDWVEVQYGDDDHETCIVADNDEHARGEVPEIVDSTVE